MNPIKSGLFLKASSVAKIDGTLYFTIFKLGSNIDTLLGASVGLYIASGV